MQVRPPVDVPAVRRRDLHGGPRVTAVYLTLVAMTVGGYIAGIMFMDSSDEASTIAFFINRIGLVLFVLGVVWCMYLASGLEVTVR